MKDKVNKPRVFLSHSSRDKPFIEKLAADLRKCQIEPWLDTDEVRDGRSWLKVIFEDGIPSCDAVLVYFTENSLRSRMVEKELDASVVEQLSDGGITILPYVSRGELRSQLRSDVRSLQCREWDERNYQDLLPSIIAEIWRSYLERILNAALLQEKNRRLEVELELKQLKENNDASVFRPSEVQEFQYLFKRLDRRIEIIVGIYSEHGPTSNDSKLGKELWSLSWLGLLLNLVVNGHIYFDHYYFQHYLINKNEDLTLPDNRKAKRYGGEIEDEVVQGLYAELHTYGLVKLTRTNSDVQSETHYEFSEKFYRFKYWLDYNRLVPDDSVEKTLKLDRQRALDEHNDEDQTTARALEAERKISQARRLAAWRTSGEGIQAGTDQVETLFKDLEQRVLKSNEVWTTIRLEFTQISNERCIVTNGVVNLDVAWETPTILVQDSLLRVSLHLLIPTSQREPHQLYALNYRVDANDDLMPLWVSADGSGRELSSTRRIGENFWSNLLSYIQRIEEGTL